MEVVALILMLFTIILLIVAYKVRNLPVAIFLIIAAGYLFNVSTMYGTTHTIKTNGELVYGYTFEFGWPIRFAVQTDTATPLNDGATISFRVGGVIGSVIDKQKMYMNMLLYIFLFTIILMIVRKRKRNRA